MWGKQISHEPEVKCSEVTAPDIFIEEIPRQKIHYLMEEYPHQEWLGYLVGKRSSMSNFFVEDITIPPHKEVSSASAEAEPFHVPLNCIGVIHSHHNMGAFHSGIDRTHVDRNFPVSITVAMNGGSLVYDAVSYQVTPCGKEIRLNCSVKYVQPAPLFDKEAFLKEAKQNIDKGKRQLAVYPLCEAVQFTFDRKANKYIPIGNKIHHKGKAIRKEAEGIRQRLREEYGVEITRSEAEDIVLSGNNTSWLFEG